MQKPKSAAPPQAQQIPSRKKVIMLGGHHHGCAALDAFRGRYVSKTDDPNPWSLRNLFHVVKVVVDRNRPWRRLYRHDAVVALQKSGFAGLTNFHQNIRDEWTKRDENGPCVNGEVRTIIQRSFDFEMGRMVDKAMSLGFDDDEIVAEVYSEKLLLRLITETGAGGIVIATYGSLLSQKVIDAVNGNVYVAHPAFLINPYGEVEDELIYRDRKFFLDERVRGALVMDTVVGQENMQVYISLIRADAGPDTGCIVGRSRVNSAPAFRAAERENLSLCVAQAQLATAGLVNELLQFELVRQFYTANELFLRDVPLGKAKSFGYKDEELLQAGYGLIQQTGPK